MTDYSTCICACRCGLAALLAVCLSACASKPGPFVVNEQADYGAFPEDYPAITSAYLQAQPRRVPLDLSSAQFLNTPDRFTFSQLGREDKYGYRVCVLVSPVNDRDPVSNFLLINNGKVIEHLHDSGLIDLSDKFCDVQTLLLVNKQLAAAAAPVPAPAIVTTVPVETEVAPAVTAAVPVEAEIAPAVAATVPVETVDRQGIKYLVCRSSAEQVFFAFNAEKNQLQEQRDGRVVTALLMEQLSDTYIVATAADDTRLSINRVSGQMRYQRTGSELQGECELDRRQQF